MNPYDILSLDDFEIARQFLGSYSRIDRPDLVIAPDGKPYLYRWFLAPRDKTRANVYFHLQVASDPVRPLHDHPWDNVSHIIAGGYEEHIAYADGFGVEVFLRTAGQVIYRRAEDAHQLILPEDVPYSMSLFTTGPMRRDWGFWYPEGWVSHKEVCQLDGNVSTHRRVP